MHCIMAEVIDGVTSVSPLDPFIIDCIYITQAHIISVAWT